MREIVAEFHTRMARFDSGERFPLVLDKRGIPLCDPALYLANERELAVNTLDSKARTIAMVHNFLRAYGIDLRARLADGHVLDYAETSALRHYIRTVGSRSRMIEARRNPEHSKRAAKGREIVAGQEWHRRRLRAADYLGWLVDRVKTELRVAPHQSIRIEKELAKAVLIISDGAGPATAGDQAALSPEQWPILLEAIRPGSGTNPFAERHQFRNFALIATYWENGLRRSEAMGLQVEDLSAAGDQPTLKLVYRPDDPDETRARPPGLKTMPRAVPITPILHGVLWEYINLHRRQIPSNKGHKDAMRRLRSNPFIFVSSRGSPLSLSSVQKIFDTLRMRTAGLPVNLSPHALRRTWNDMFTEMRGESLGPRETELREFLMGWVRGSPQTARYARGSTQREAHQAIVEMQQQWMSRWEALRNES